LFNLFLVCVGVEDGMTIRVPGEGDAAMSSKGSAGDLLVRVNVASSKVFRRQGVHLHHDARIPLHVALLGGRVRVPTLDGDVDVRVPAGTQQGEEMVLKGRGVVPVFGGDKGDLFVSFLVQLPRLVEQRMSVLRPANSEVNRSLTERQRSILQQYADDVEGRSGGSASATQLPSGDGKTKTSTAFHDNGTTSFVQPSSSGGWTRIFEKIRGLIGI
jgi:molecular chaperone DnaJ